MNASPPSSEPANESGRKPGLVKLARGLHATPSAPLPFMDGVEIRSFVLETAQGPVIVYNDPGIDQVADEIRALGTPQKLLINHWHENMHGTPKLQVSTAVHERDRAQTEQKLRVDETFQAEANTRQRIGDDLEIIPSFGHTAGAAFYLWDSGEHRYLFPGDSLWVDEAGIWRAVILGESDPQAFLDTLRFMRDLDFDVLAPWPSARSTRMLSEVTAEQKNKQVDGLIDRITRGARGPLA